MHSIVVFASILAIACAAPYQPVKQAASSYEGNKYLPPSLPEVAPDVQKHFYYVSAHEEPEHLEHKHLTVGHPKKDYRVIFIKSPASNTKHKYSIDVAPQEEKTAIYVLTKKNEGLSHEDFALSTSSQNSKPEVFFIKYKNEEEVELAKKEIQGTFPNHIDYLHLH